MHAPICEQLENRILLSTIYWDGGGDGINWSDPLNWDTDILPAAADDVVLDVAADPEILHDLAQTTQINSLLINEFLTVRAGALEVATTSHVNNLLTLHGGALIGGRWEFQHPRLFAVSEDPANRLVDVEISGNPDVRTNRAQGQLRIQSGLAIDGVFTSSARNVTIYFDGSQSITSGQLFLQDGIRMRITGSSDSTLIIDSNAEVFSTGGGLIAEGPASYTIQNDGLIRASASLTLNANQIINNGEIRIEGSAQYLSLYGTLTTNDLDTVYTPEAIVLIYGTLINSGDTLVLDPARMPSVLLGGKIIGGTVEIPVGGFFRTFTVNATLDDVIVNGDIEILALRVTNGLQLNGTASFLGESSELIFEGSQTISAGLFILNSQNSSRIGISGADTDEIVFGPDVMFTGGQGSIGRASGEGSPILINQGQISITGPQSRLSIAPAFFRNEGIVEASDGSLLLVGSTNNGSVWENTGTFRVDNATLNFGGTVATPQIGTIDRTGGTVNVLGTIDNTDSVLSFDQQSGSWRLFGGEIIGGQINNTPVDKLELTSEGGTLQATTVQGDLFLVEDGSWLTIRDSLELLGTVRLIGDDTGIAFMGTNTFDSGTISFESSRGMPAIFVERSEELTIGPAATIQGSFGTIGQRSLGRIVNHGRIIATTSGQRLAINVDRFENHGAIEARSGAILRVGDDSESASTAWINHGDVIAPSGIIELNGILDLLGGEQILDATTGSWVLDGGIVINGTLSFFDGASLDITLNPRNELRNLVVNGDIVLERLRARFKVRSGLTVNGSVRLLTTNSRIEFWGTQTFNGHISIEGQAYIDLRGPTLTTVTLAPGTVLDGGGGGAIRNVDSGTRTLVNQGLIRCSGPDEVFWVNPSNLVNESQIEALGGAELSVNGTWRNNGTFTVIDSTLLLSGFFNIFGLGTIVRSNATILLRGILDLANETLEMGPATGEWILSGGTIQNGTIRLDENNPLVIAFNSYFRNIHLIGDLVIDDDFATLNVADGLSIDGAIRIQGAGVRLNFQVGQTFSSGEIVFESTAGQLPSLRVVGASSEPQFIVGKDAIIRGGRGQINGPSTGDEVLILRGTIMADQPGEANALEITVDYFTNAGIVQAANGATLTFAPATQITNITDGTLTGGQWIVEDNSTLSIPSPILTNNASITLRGQNASFAALNTLAANSGMLTLENGAQLAITPTDNLFTNAGRISIDPTSTLTITGDYIQTPQGTLAIGAAGPPKSPIFGQLIATGSATLAGTFELAFAKALEPNCGTDFHFISASTVSGQFETLTLPDPPEFHKYPVLYDATGVRLLTTSIADLDNSGTVNIIDFLAFLNFFNDADPIADFNGDGIINTQDFIAYLNAFNHGC